MKKIYFAVLLASWHLACASKDNRIWKETLFPDLKLYNVYWVNNQFVVSGSDKNGQMIALTSTDGTNWVMHNTGVPQANGFIFINNKFIANGTSGNLLISTDMITWTPVKPNLLPMITYLPHDANKLIYGNGTYSSINFQSCNFITSSDFLTWTIQRLQNNKWCFTDLYFANNTYFAYGYNDGSNVFSKTVFESTDGLNWQEIQSLRGTYFTSIIYANGKYIVAGDGVYTSTDGQKWDNHSIFFGPRIDHAASGPGDYILLSSQKTLEIWSTSDSVNWRQYVYKHTPDGIMYWFGDPDWSLNSAVNNGSLYVVAGYDCSSGKGCTGVILTSP